MPRAIEKFQTDILILGAGGAGLLAALHARRAAPDLSIALAVKGLLGKSGCTRLSEGGYNVALGAGDSVERHFRDTIEAGKWLPDQELAWTLVSGAMERINEFERELDFVFDRNPDGSMHQKKFAGQSFDRTLHKGDLTGIALSNCLVEHVLACGIDRLEEHRALELVKNKAGDAVAGVVMMDVRTGEHVFVRARAVLLATGGGPTMYKYHSAPEDKSCDGMAMALRAGLALRDMEMVQFHPTGLLVSAGTRMTGLLLEEALRNAGAHLLNGARERFMNKYDPRGECATRDIVSRAIFSEISAGKGSPNGGAYLSVVHLGADNNRNSFISMVERCREYGVDLAGSPVELVPTAHYMMGGVVIKPDCSTELRGLFVAGEDAGGVHGANRLSGNGIADATVFGAIAGDAMARWGKDHRAAEEPDADAVEAAARGSRSSPSAPACDFYALRESLYETMWNDVGITRDEQGLSHAECTLDEIDARLDDAGVPDDALAASDRLDLKNLVLVSKAIRCAALARTDSRGAHFRVDHPDMIDVEHSRYTCVRWRNGCFDVETKPVEFSRVKPGH